MNYQTIVSRKYQIYNSLFISLPFQGIESTGTHLALFGQECRNGLKNGKNPVNIVETFLDEYFEELNTDERLALLFQFIQYAERQVVLFDSSEDAAFEKTHALEGKGSVSHLLESLDADEKRQKLIQKLSTYCVRIVLTAHPTQFYPGKVLGIINDLGTAIRDSDLESIEDLLKQLGKTAFVNRTKPTPLDEAVSLGWYLENVFFNALPDSVFRLLKGLGLHPHDFSAPRLLALGFWPGGDRDGNPFVTADISKKVAQRLRESILRCYYRDIRNLKRRLTFRGTEEWIAIVESKLYATLYNPEQEHYGSCTALIEDLIHARKILIEQHDGLFIDLLDLFILKVRMFGFYFASLDIRQDSRKHGEVWQHILSNLETNMPIFSSESYHNWDEEKKMNFLLTNKIPVDENEFADPFVKETLRSFRTIAEVQQSNGEAGCHRYIISNCQSALNVVEVLALARLCFDHETQFINPKSIPPKSGLSPQVPLDIVPLFETIDDLAQAGGIMEKLYTNAQYAAHLKARNNIQTIMLGFSDGTKDGGYLRANWSIYRAKEALTKVSREHGISVIFFDGRGGPPGRGGGNNASYYAAHGPEIENREIHVTIQGQTVSSTYGTETAARFNIERLFTAGLENHLFQTRHGELTDADKTVMDNLAEEAYKAYLKLKDDPNFVPYLEKMTPLKWYGDSNIASRPTKRSGSDSLKFEDLRAIPFVGAWAQMKQNVPGFYGFGAAIHTFKQNKQMEQLKKLYEDSLFFRTLVENSMQSLSKSNFDVTRYMAKDKQFGYFWKMLNDEFKRTREMLLTLSGQTELLSDNPISRKSIHMREEIVLPLITMQQFALQKLHDEKLPTETADIYKKIVLRTMFGIINAARNSA